MRKVFFLFWLFLAALPVTGQALGTGSYPFATFDSRGFDSVNVGNLNVRFTIPIVSRTGRGLPFNYSLQYEGLVWSNVGGVWTPDPSWGMTGVLNGTAFAGYITHQRFLHSCPSSGSRPGNNRFFELTNYIYHDAFGAKHQFDADYTSSCPDTGGGDDTWTGDGSTDDNSGYSLDMANQSVVHTRSGATITPAQSATGQDTSGMSDANGNQISGNGSGSFTDTLGATALTITGSSPRVFTYPVTLQSNSATTASTTLSYQTYTVRTNFSCSGVVEYGSTAVSLPDRVTFADGSFYAFTYEPTVGTTSGEVTGRLASITLPTGGTINYSYTAGCGNGMNSDGTPGSLSRTTSDGTRQYNRSYNTPDSTFTTLIDEKNNQTLYTFSKDSTTQKYFETHRQVYQGNIGGTPLMDQLTCYNNATANCDGQAVTLPISEADVTLSYNGGTTTLTKNTYDPNGTLLTGSVLSSGGNTLTSTSSSYNGQGNLTATTSNAPGGTAYTDTIYGYDESGVTATSGIPQHGGAVGSPRGNLTSSHISIGATTLDTSTTYYDTGQPASSTAQDGGVTTYSYDATQGFVTGMGLPTPSSGVALSTSAQYDATSAAVLSSSGMNANETTTVSQYDAMMRPINVTLPSGSTVTMTYNQYEGLQHTMKQQTQDSNRTTYSEVLLDAYGRLSRTGRYAGLGVWYQMDYCYDSTGLLQFQSAAYQSTGFYGANGPTQKYCSGLGTTYAYDALGRVTSATNQDGTTSTQYSGRAVKTSDVNGVAKITQYDLMGRISGVCEISSTAYSGQSPSACGMDITGTGYLTSYSYDLVNHTTTISQGGQVRTFITDAAGRSTSTTEPERGTTTYAYSFTAGDGLKVTRTRAKANQTNASVLTTTTTQYDRLGRVTGTTYDDGLTQNSQFFYEQKPSWMGWSNVPANTKGRLTATYRASGTSSQYSYDISGHVVDMWQCAPSNCYTLPESRPTLHYTYDLAGSLMSSFDGMSGNIVYTRTEAEEVTSVTNATYTGTGNPPSLLSNVVNSVHGPVNWATGDGLESVRSYDMFGRVRGNFDCSGTRQMYCNGGTTVYGNAVDYRGPQLTQVCDSSFGSLCRQAGYDDLNRVTSLSSSEGSSTYAYDRWGNRTYANGASYSFNGNQQTGMGYDAAGNQTSDGVHSYTYDADGKVLQVDGGTTAKYVYDVMDQRVRITTQSEDTEYLFDPFGRRQSSWNVSGNAGSEGRIYSDGMLLANRSGNGQTYFHHGNYLGTERARTNYLGTVVSTTSSGPFGENQQPLTTDTWSTQDNTGYTGQEHDNVTGTDHFLYRQYQETLGRWMSPDPYDGSYSLFNPQSLNRYAYVMGNPLGMIDHSGLFALNSDFYSFFFGQWWLQEYYGMNYAAGIFAQMRGVTPNQTQTTSTPAPKPNPKPTPAPNNLNKPPYTRTMNCSSSASQVMGAVEGNFAQYGNYSRYLGTESVSFAPPANIGVGSTIPITVGILGINQSLSVNVAAMNSGSMTFTTNPGHLIYPGSITFAASPAGAGAINFSISISGTVANSAEFNFGGSAFEDAQWNHFLGQVGSFCGVHH